LNIVYGERREGDITSAYADASLALKLLNWKAELGLKEMVTSAWEWETKLVETCEQET
jgi:UDP-glucose 4-epimerase